MDLRLAELKPLETYKLLIGLVIPRPIAWISTWSPAASAAATRSSILDRGIASAAYTPRFRGSSAAISR